MDELTESFKDTYDSEDAYDVVTQAGDVAIDAIIDGGLLDGVPVLGMLKSAYKATRNFQLHRLMKKVHRFIFKTGDISLREREDFIAEYTEKNRENGYEALLAVIERLDNTNKVDVLANLMKAKLRGKIGIKDFIRLTAILERIPFSDLSELPKYENDYFEDGSADVLLSAGVLYNTVLDAEGPNKYRLNSLGESLLRYGLGYNIDIKAREATRLPVSEWKEVD